MNFMPSSKHIGALFVVLGILCTVPSYSKPSKLKKEDVRVSMEDILKNHVSYQALSPVLAKRALKLYVEHIDPQKVYLMYDEVKNFIEPSDDFLQKIIASYRKDSFSVFQEIDALMVRAIKRARGWRRVVLDSQPQNKALVYGQFAKTELELRQRSESLFSLFVLTEAGDQNFASVSVERQEKLIRFAEKYFERIEKPYLVSGSDLQHFQSLRVLKAFAKSLDAHTMYFSPEEAFELRASLEKQFEGVGIVIREGVDGVVIVNVLEGGPAERSGLIYKGDIIASIDGKSVLNASYEEVLERLKGNGKTLVRLVVKRYESAGKEVLVEAVLCREKIVMTGERVQVVAEAFGDGVIGKITVPAFYESEGDSSCAQDVLNALRDLRRQGKLLGVVLDLRDNSGGFLGQAIKMASLFISSGVIVISKYAHDEVQYFRNIDGKIYYDGPLVILNSKASASAAEIVAQALQDYGIALIVGDKRSYGKGTIQYQTVTDENARAFFKVTVGRYYTVSGKSTQIEGVQADIHVPTVYAPYRIGERYLEYPLPSDRMAPAYIDPLTDVDAASRGWLQRYYVPLVQQRETKWTQMLPQLQKNSSYRLDHSSDFQVFIKAVESAKLQPEVFIGADWGAEDLQMQEAVNIVKDMIIYQHTGS